MTEHHSISTLRAIANVRKGVPIITTAPGSGVCGHSTDEFWSEYAVFSVGDDRIIDAAFKAWCRDNGIGFKALIGSYKGQTESSFIARRSNLLAIAEGNWLKGQESVLLLSMPKNMGGGQFYRNAALLYLEDGREEPVGRFIEAGRDKAMKQDGWTYDPASGKYWICE